MNHVQNAAIPLGLCQCGCRERTSVAKKSRSERGHREGHPMKFLPHHFTRTRVRSSHGYIMRFQEDGKYKYEHVLVAEKSLGRKLPPGAVVHHANGITDDNKNCNLVICESQAYHRLLHRRARAFSATGNANARRCYYCRGWGLDLKVRGTRSSYHPSCKAAYDRAWRIAHKDHVTESRRSKRATAKTALTVRKTA